MTIPAGLQRVCVSTSSCSSPPQQTRAVAALNYSTFIAIILTSSSPPSWRGLQAAISSSAPMTQDNMGLATAPPLPAIKLILLAVPARQALKIVGNIGRSKSKIHGRLFKLARLCFHSVVPNLFCACANKQPIMPSHHHIFLTARCPDLFVAGTLGPSTSVNGDRGWWHRYEPDLLLARGWKVSFCVCKMKKAEGLEARFSSKT